MSLKECEVEKGEVVFLGVSEVVLKYMLNDFLRSEIIYFAWLIFHIFLF